MSDRVDRETGEILDQTTFVATGTLAGLLDSTQFREQLRDLDARIADADSNIDVLREHLKDARRYREQLVAALRATARGDRTLPFDPSPSKE